MKWFLVIRLIWAGQHWETASAKFDTREQCFAALAVAELKIPEHNSENEWAGFKVCLPEDNAKWKP